MDVGRLKVWVVPPDTYRTTVLSEPPPQASRRVFASCEALILQGRFSLGTPLAAT